MAEEPTFVSDLPENPDLAPEIPPDVPFDVEIMDAQPPDDYGTIPMPPEKPKREPFRPPSAWDVLFYGLLILILAVGAWLRFDAQNWDDFTHLHPDERFLTQVVEGLNGSLRFTDKGDGFLSDVQVQEQHRARCVARYPNPEPVGEYQMAEPGRGGYWDADCSPLNPNNLGFGLYVYGEFPLFTTYKASQERIQLSEDYHALLLAFDEDAANDHVITRYWDTYVGSQLVGRTVAAITDWLTILVAFLLGRRLYGRWTGLLAAGVYAVAAFPIQQAHFWTVDSFATFWVALALYCAVRAMDGASEIQGPPALSYLAVWAVGVIWEMFEKNYSPLGLLSLGVIVLVVALLIQVARFITGRRGSDTLLVAAAPIASLIYLIGWAVAIGAAPHDFTLTDEIMGLGFAALIYGLLVGIMALARRVRLNNNGFYLLLGSISVLWITLVIVVILGGLSSWPALFVAVASVLLVGFSLIGAVDYALFGVALGAAVATRINMAPLAVLIGVAAVIRSLPALDASLTSRARYRMLIVASIGVMVAALTSAFVFRVLQPHAFQGPGFFDVFKFNPGWSDDAREAQYLTSGQWDGPPNHQWTSRTPYLFPWRNIVLWGFGIPFGLIAWAAWAYAGFGMVMGRRNWTRHAILFLWILLCFGWLGGRWVTTMRYFLPIYPALSVFGAWLLIEGIRTARKIERPLPVRRIAYAGSILLLVIAAGYSLWYGFAMHNIHRHQLTRVAASRWFQEKVPGDFGIWVDGNDGSRQLINIGVAWQAGAPSVAHVEQGETVEFTTLQGQPDPVTGQPLLISVPGDATLTRILLQRVGDPNRDPEEETLRVRLFRNDPNLGRQLVYEGEVSEDFSEGMYGRTVTLDPDEDIHLTREIAPGVAAAYVIQITVTDGGPVMFSHNITEPDATILNDVSLMMRMDSDQTITALDFNLPEQPLLTGFSDEIPAVPTEWTTGGHDTIAFEIPIDGVIREMDIPHLGDALRDLDAETVKFTLIAPDGQQTSATITGDFNEGANPLGPPVTVTFDPPLVVQHTTPTSNRGTLMIEAQDPIYTSGPVIAWEGDWDDPVPWQVCPLPPDVEYSDDLPSGLSEYTCNAIGMYGTHYQGLQLRLSWEDSDAKRTAMLNALDQADYIVITSNRFYDTLSRIPMRFPMTLAYFDALFDGRLGFELVRTFESHPQYGPFGVRDQVLPFDDVPDWVNEHWEAEEAFSVYDHPIVLVYRKTDAYSSENTQAILDSVTLRTTQDAYASYIADPATVGIVQWSAPIASKAPTMLEMPDDKAEIQREGGTWSKLFDMDNLINRSQVAAVIIWWLLMVISGWLIWPLLFSIFPMLPDRGYPAAKIVMWLLIAWIAWAGGTANLKTWTRPGLWLIMIGLSLFSFAVSWRRRSELIQYIRANFKHLLMVEGLALLLYLGFLGVRLGNPDLWHAWMGGEKPMDFAYFNAVLRSTVFPPLDPWYAEGYINYYYFGYVIVGAPVKLLGLNPSVAYNLILPMLYSMTGTGVFSIAYNWVRSRRVIPGEILHATSDEGVEAEPESNEIRPPRGSAWVAGILAMMLAIVLGNLGIMHLIVTEVAKMDGWQQRPMYYQVRRDELNAHREDIYNDIYNDLVAQFRDDHNRAPETAAEIGSLNTEAQKKTNSYIMDEVRHPPLVSLWRYELDGLDQQMSAFRGGMKKVLAGEPLQVSSNRWYWAPRSLINELPNGAGNNAINEMPYFTFLYGDLHAHLISMPITMLALLWLVSEIMGAGYALRRWWESLIAFGLGGLAVGVLRPTNSWDWITYMILAALALLYAAWVGAARSSRDFPPSAAADRVWSWIRPRNIRWVVFVLMIVMPLAALARVAYYMLLKMQAKNQAEHGIPFGAKAVVVSPLTFSSVLIWVIGGMALTALAYVLLVVILRAYMNKRHIVGGVGRVGLFAAVSMIAAMPFTAYFATAYTSTKPWKPECTAFDCFWAERTPIWTYMYIHGLFIFIITTFLIWQTARHLRRARVSQLQGLIIPVGAVIAVIAGAIVVSLVMGVREIPILQVVGPLIVWSMILFFMPRQSPMLRAIYVLIVLALGLTLGVEVIVLDGDIGRQNTVFKFYLQAWFFFSVTGGVALAWMLRNSERWHIVLRAAWHTVLAILFTISLLYPLLGTQGRFADRFNRAETPLTLDGMEYMKHAVHNVNGINFRLDGDYHMIRWMQENVEGSPVIMEAQMPGVQYQWSSRINIYTGLPTVLGWSWHQIQQRSLPEMDKLIHTRENNVSAFYGIGGLEGIQDAWDIIQDYDVEYIVVGVFERIYYADVLPDATTGLNTPNHSAGLQKFDTMVEMGLLEVVYERPGCLDTNITSIEECPADSVYIDRIYRVVPGAEYDEGVAGNWLRNRIFQAPQPHRFQPVVN